MRRATKIQPAGSFDASRAVDRVVLDADERHRRRIVLTGENGTKFLLDLDHAVALREGDGLVLDDGAVVIVAGKLEPLTEIEARSPLGLVRLAWHLGNHHSQVQILGTKLRIRRDPVLESMIAGLGGKLTPIEAPFEPEGGAHSHARGEHVHHEHAHHDHSHDDHAHVDDEHGT
jgi:urease accessory protein